MKRNLRALLFDLDGTLLDTGELHFEATVAALAEFGKSIDRVTYDRDVHGNNNADIMSYFFPHDPAMTQRAYVERKESAFRDSLGVATPLRGLIDVLAWATEKDIRVGLVTNAPEENKNAMLEAIGLTGQFHPVILGDDLPKAKPHPLPFLTALDVLGIAPDEAIGFDDSIHGIRAVAAAGMFAVGVETGQAGSELIQNGADIVIEDYHAPELIELLSSRCLSPEK